ncbi:DHS-like NAD/FAD-binding domain-containing protein [Chytridium lagenaria]|nr:DHS-like NAD/FAD-binding domain-containing protein [Chytridium lagenaria]
MGKFHESRKNSQEFMDMCNKIRERSLKTSSSLAHKLFKLLEINGWLMRCYTQNIDGLERRPPSNLQSNKLVQLHGDVFHSKCTTCNNIVKLPSSSEFKLDVKCSECPPVTQQGRPLKPGLLLPNVLCDGGDGEEGIVDHVESDAKKKPVVIVIGTSCHTHGVIDIVRKFAKAQCQLIWVNPLTKAPAGIPFLQSISASAEEFSFLLSEKLGVAFSLDAGVSDGYPIVQDNDFDTENIAKRVDLHGYAYYFSNNDNSREFIDGDRQQVQLRDEKMIEKVLGTDGSPAVNHISNIAKRVFSQYLKLKGDVKKQELHCNAYLAESMAVLVNLSSNVYHTTKLQPCKRVQRPDSCGDIAIDNYGRAAVEKECNYIKSIFHQLLVNPDLMPSRQQADPDYPCGVGSLTFFDGAMAYYESDNPMKLPKVTMVLSLTTGLLKLRSTFQLNHLTATSFAYGRNSFEFLLAYEYMKKKKSFILGILPIRQCTQLDILLEALSSVMDKRGFNYACDMIFFTPFRKELLDAYMKIPQNERNKELEERANMDIT